MNKNELITKVAKEEHLTKQDVNNCVNNIFNTIKEVVADGKKFKIIDFGSFEAHTRKARVGVNPQTGQKMNIPAHKNPSFSAGRDFKNRVKNLDK